MREGTVLRAGAVGMSVGNEERSSDSGPALSPLPSSRLEGGVRSPGCEECEGDEKRFLDWMGAREMGLPPRHLSDFFAILSRVKYSYKKN
jgi:hypothetical protein